MRSCPKAASADGKVVLEHWISTLSCVVPAPGRAQSNKSGTHIHGCIFKIAHFIDFGFVFVCVWSHCIPLSLPPSIYSSLLLILQQASLVQSAFFFFKCTEVLSSRVKTNTRSTEGKQHMGQSVFSGRSAESRKSGLLALIFSFIYSFLIEFPFSSEMPLSVKVSCICALWHRHCSNGRVEQSMESTQSQTNSSRIWPECFAWIPASQKAKEKYLALCYVHGHGKPRRVSCGVLWAPKQRALFSSTYRQFRSLQACHDSAWMTPDSLCKLKCETAHGSFWYGKMVL